MDIKPNAIYEIDNWIVWIKYINKDGEVYRHEAMFTKDGEIFDKPSPPIHFCAIENIKEAILLHKPTKDRKVWERIKTYYSVL